MNQAAVFTVAVNVEPRVPFGRMQPYDQDAIDEVAGVHAIAVPASVLDELGTCPAGKDRVQWICEALEMAALERFHDQVRLGHPDDFVIMPEADRAAIKLQVMFNKNYPFPIRPAQPALAEDDLSF